MRGHIKKRVLLRRRKRYRRRRWIREFKPIIRQNPQDCFIEKLYPKTGIFINNYILRFNNLTFLRSFNLIYRYDSYFSFKFFFYKLMFDINRYFFFRQQLILKNIRLVNLK